MNGLVLCQIRPVELALKSEDLLGSLLADLVQTTNLFFPCVPDLLLSIVNFKSLILWILDLEVKIGLGSYLLRFKSSQLLSKLPYVRYHLLQAGVYVLNLLNDSALAFF